MTLNVGTTLGPYEIVSSIGAGGMGEVYKANDTRLDRTVAIKVLPSHLADDADLKERFEREARAVSSLNHPHICTLHDVGYQDGVDFLVMEYIEGETLADRLQKGPLSFEEALRYAIQIADALEKAHRKGVVHRDLKPGNIMLTATGAKLLDFGLAKFQEDQAADELSSLPTQQKSLTEKGTIIGTFQYMSPEQLEGDNADARTDVFAFGALLFEMLTGRKAFEGKSQASLIAAILERDPPSVASIQPMSPPGIDRLVRQCLAKDPDERWQSAGDIKRELEWIAGTGGELAPSTSAPRAKSLPGHLAFALGGLVVGALLAWNWRTVAPSNVTRFAVDLPESVRFTHTGRHVVALSPDGTHLVHTGNDQLYLRAMDDMVAAPVRGTEAGTGARSPFFSPDGEWIGFYRDGELVKIPITGGAPVKLCASNNLYGASWSSDGTILFAQGSGGILRVSASGGEPELLVEVDADALESAQSPELLPGGDAVLFTLARGGRWDAAQIVVQSLESGERDVLIEGGTDARYVPTGHLVYAIGTSLFAVAFDIANLEVEGGSVPVLEGVRRAGPITGGSQFAVSRSGAIAYVPDDVAGERARKLVWVDRAGSVEPVTNAERLFRQPKISHRGDRLVVGIGSILVGDAWVLDLARDALTRLTFDGAYAPIWTPDDRRVVYASSWSGGITEMQIYWKPADGTGQQEPILADDEPLMTSGSLVPFSWSSDASSLVFRQIRAGGGDNDIGVVAMEFDRHPELLFETGFAEGHPVLSADGRWLAYTSDESGRTEVYVRSFPDSGGRWQVSTEGGTEPRWNPAGGELFFRRGDGMWVVPFVTEPAFQPGSAALLFEGVFEPGDLVHNYDVSSDGQRFVMVESADPSGSNFDRVHVVLNWHDELERRVPVN